MITVKSIKLLKCPFCGSTPHKGVGKIENCQTHGEPFQRFWIACPKGHARVNGVNEALAYEEWNTQFS